jgi:hypothetical protein
MNKIGLVCCLGVVLFALGCGHPTAMTSMTITPTSSGVVGFGDTIPTQFTVYGKFIHPSETRDITSEVTWSSAVPAVATVSADGLVTPTGTACGSTIITATAGQKLVGGGDTDSQAEMNVTATFTVYVVSNPGCPAPPTT